MEKNVTPRKKNQMKQVPTLLQAIERVVELSRDSKLSDEFMQEASPELILLSEMYGITERQAVFFCVCMEKGPRRVDFDDLASHLDINKIRILSYSSDIDALARHRLLRYRDAKDEDCFDIPQPVIKAMKHNEAFKMPSRTNMDCASLFEVIGQMFEDLDDDAILPEALYEELKKLFEENPQIGFCKKIKELGRLRMEDFLLLVFFCHQLVNKDDDDIRFGQMEDCFTSQADYVVAKGRLRNSEHPLIIKKLIEHRCEDGIADTSRYKLTEQTKRHLLAEMRLNIAEEKLADVIKAKDLKEKKMFYVEENQRQVSELQSFFVPENYQRIRERMEQTGFRTGFACLFYGGPGTGKTETVYQLARQTGRDIMVVDVPQIKSKWVGDSEKNIKALFDRYRELVKKAKQTPILLFNEADAIIGIRQQGVQRAVEKMENSIQNIILQEMETLDGIMIATTNLQQNLDKAFERRFLYKIKFEKPTVEARIQIWRTMIPDLSEMDVKTLAAKYDFSGGQIENIARHYTIDSILHDAKEDKLAMLINHCDNERLDENTPKRIGF